jgi:hypothetical protein
MPILPAERCAGSERQTVMAIAKPEHDPQDIWSGTERYNIAERVGTHGVEHADQFVFGGKLHSDKERTTGYAAARKDIFNLGAKRQPR